MVRYQDVVDVTEREQCKCGPRGSVSCFQICVKNGKKFSPGQNSVTDGTDGTSLECDCLEGGEWSCSIQTTFSSSSSSSQRYCFNYLQVQFFFDNSSDQATEVLNFLKLIILRTLSFCRSALK